MPEYLSPGVYVEEVDAGPKPIEGVSTSTTGVVGVTAFGPTSGKPELVTSFAEFTRKFGGFLPEPDPAIFNSWALDQAEGGRWWYFPLSVKGFFDNGGQRLYVKRVFSSTATAAASNLGSGMISEIVKDAANGATELQLRHLIDIAVTLNNVNVALTVFRGDTNVQIGGNFAVSSYDPKTNKVKLGAALPAGVVAKRGDYVEIHTRSAAPVSGANATLTFRAKSKGVWGNALSVRVRPMVGATLNIQPDVTIVGMAFQTATVGVTAPVGNPPTTRVEVTDVTGLANGDKISVLTKTYVISNIDGPTKKFDITPSLATGESWPAATAVDRVRADSTTVVSVTGPPFEYTVDDIRDFADNDHVLIEGKEYVVTATNAGAKKFKLNDTLGNAAGDNWAGGTAIKRMHEANKTNVAPTLNVRGASSLYAGALVELSNGKDKETFTVLSTAGETATLSGNLLKAYFEGHKLRVIEAEVSVRYMPNGVVEAEELFSNLRLVNDGSLSYIVNFIKERSALVEAVEGAALSDSDLTKFPAVPSPSPRWLDLAGGDDKPADLSPDDFVGIDGGSGSRTGIQALEDIDEVSICAAPGMWSGTVQSALIQHCETLKDRFAILDPQDGLSIEGIRAFREPLDSKYAAIYYPWIEVRDPSVKRNVDVAPSGHMAGIYARVDVERGVHKAPANEVIRGITKIAQDVTKREQDMLNPKGINALRFFPGRGNRVWGARTVSSDASWKYINVRRLFIYVEESIDEGTQFVVFEPNDEPLWARVRQTITNFLTSVWRSGALQGSTAAEAFFVKCDHTTMTQDDIDNGRLICVIGIAPVKPAEFVIFRIQQKTLGSEN
jgi:phage tail sheath protein FI